MNIKIIKRNQIDIGWVPNVTEIIDLGVGTMRIVGHRTCETCGHIEDVVYDTEWTDMICVETHK